MNPPAAELMGDVDRVLAEAAATLQLAREIRGQLAGAECPWRGSR